MHTLTVTLKQHTPLIHFQHNQTGATLRASEVKPKLDKFIVQKEFNDDFSKCRSFLSGYDAQKPDSLYEKFNDRFRALNYKLRIKAEGQGRHFIIASYLNQDKEASARSARKDAEIISKTPYFAQEKEYRYEQWNELSKEGILHDKIAMTFTCGNMAILELIAKHIQVFFARYNFGTRQSKGFGSFSVCGISSSYQAKYSIRNYDDLMKESFAFVYKNKRPKSQLKDIFSCINEDYKLIKSGNSRTKEKSLLMRYYYDRRIRWEKRFIKQKYGELNLRYMLKGSAGRAVDRDPAGTNYKFIRALLGLPGTYEFMLHNPPRSNSKMIVKVTSPGNEIERYQSPITIKVYNGIIYIAGNEANRKIMEKNFTLLCSIENTKEVKDRRLGNIQTPNDFSLSEFMRYAMSQGQFRNNYQALKQ